MSNCFEYRGLEKRTFRGEGPGQECGNDDSPGYVWILMLDNVLCLINKMTKCLMNATVIAVEITPVVRASKPNGRSLRFLQILGLRLEFYARIDKMSVKGQADMASYLHWDTSTSNDHIFDRIRRALEHSPTNTDLDESI